MSWGAVSWVKPHCPQTEKAQGGSNSTHRHVPSTATSCHPRGQGSPEVSARDAQGRFREQEGSIRVADQSFPLPHPHLSATQHKNIFLFLFSFFLFPSGSLSGSQSRMFLCWMRDDIRPSPRHAVTSDPAQPSITAPISLVLSWQHSRPWEWAPSPSRGHSQGLGFISILNCS